MIMKVKFITKRISHYIHIQNLAQKVRYIGNVDPFLYEQLFVWFL